MEERQSGEKVKVFFDNADKIKALLKTAALGLDDDFPRNYAYEFGNYNLVYVSMGNYGDQQRGFSRTADMLALYPNGELRSGNVRLEVRRYSNAWRFNEATMRPAIDDEVVHYGSALLAELYRHVSAEVVEQKDPAKIAKMVAFLDTEIETSTAVLDMSQKAVSGQNDQHFTDKKTGMESLVDHLNATFFSSVDLLPVSALKTALELFENRQDILAKYQELAASRDIEQVEAITRELVEQLFENGLFPKSSFQFDGLSWFPGWKDQSIDAFLRTKKDWQKHWVISQKGDIKQATREGAPLTDNPIDVIAEITGIMRYFIGKVIGNVYPHIGEKDPPLPF